MLLMRIIMNLALTALALLLGGCGGGGTSAGGSASASATSTGSTLSAPSVQRTTGAADSLSDDEIAALIYDGRVRTPKGFYAEPDVDAGKPVATRHLTNRDLTPLAAGEARFELCTDDWNQALAWSETAASRAAQYLDLVDSRTTARFFEFVRNDSTDSVAPMVRQRVYRCDYVDRAGVDLDTYEGGGGTLARTPVESGDLRDLAEYGWQFTAFNNFGHVVLSSKAAGAESAEHRMLIAVLVRDGVAPGCDRIDIQAWTHSADRASGAVFRDLETLRGFGARESAAGVEPCGAL